MPSMPGEHEKATAEELSRALRAELPGCTIKIEGAGVHWRATAANAQRACRVNCFWYEPPRADTLVMGPSRSNAHLGSVSTGGQVARRGAEYLVVLHDGAHRMPAHVVDRGGHSRRSLRPLDLRGRSPSGAATARRTRGSRPSARWRGPSHHRAGNRLRVVGVRKRSFLPDRSRRPGHDRLRVPDRPEPSRVGDPVRRPAWRCHRGLDGAAGIFIRVEALRAAARLGATC